MSTAVFWICGFVKSTGKKNDLDLISIGLKNGLKSSLFFPFLPFFLPIPPDFRAFSNQIQIIFLPVDLTNRQIQNTGPRPPANSLKLKFSLPVI
jgi:hypothetical protein